MALSHLHRAAAERQAHELVAEADAEGRHLLGEELADDRHGVFAGGRRIAGAVREEHAIGLQRQDVGGVVVAGTTVTAQPASASSRRMLRFTP